MPKFDAGTVEALEYDLTVYRPAVPDDPGHPDYERLKKLADETWAGVIPEPTQMAVDKLFQVDLPAVRANAADTLNRFLEQQRAGRRDWYRAKYPEKDADGLDNDALDTLDVGSDMDAQERVLWETLTSTGRTESRRMTLDAVAEFTQGRPSRDVLEALPWRAFEMFLGWLTGQFRPETLAAAMNP